MDVPPVGGVSSGVRSPHLDDARDSVYERAMREAMRFRDGANAFGDPTPLVERDGRRRHPRGGRDRRDRKRDRDGRRPERPDPWATVAEHQAEHQDTAPSEEWAADEHQLGAELDTYL